MEPTRISKRTARARVLNAVRFTAHPGYGETTAEAALGYLKLGYSVATDFGDTVAIHVPGSDFRIIAYSK